MKKFLCFCASLMLTFTAASAFAVDLTGTWSGEIVISSGDSFQVTFTFKQDGTKLTGTVSGPQGDSLQITEGKVDGDKISFNVSFDGMLIKHEGMITGDTIKLTTKSDSGDFPGGAMTLKRAK